MTKKNKASFNPDVVEAQENLLVDYQFLLQERMTQKDISQSELAERTGMSKARISQILSDDANPTVKTFALLFHALGDRVCVSSAPLDEVNSTQTGEPQQAATAPKWEWEKAVRMADAIDEDMVALMKRSVTVLDEQSMASNDNYGRSRRIRYVDSEVATALALENEAA